jgi:hypothetical protein
MGGGDLMDDLRCTMSDFLGAAFFQKNVASFFAQKGHFQSNNKPTSAIARDLFPLRRLKSDFLTKHFRT